MLRKLAIILLLLTTLSLSGCAQKLDGDGMVNSYTQISQEQAKEMMARDDGHVVDFPASKAERRQLAHDHDVARLHWEKRLGQNQRGRRENTGRRISF